MTAPNEELRRYATGGFVMHLTANQVVTLVEIAAYEQGYTTGQVAASGLRGQRDLFVSAAKALGDRGLVVHNPDFDPYHRRHGRWRSEKPGTTPLTSYRLTKAGRLIRDLLAEAGVWQEHWAKLPEQPAAKRLPRVRAVSA